MFFEQEQVRLAATVTSFYTRKPTQGRLLCFLSQYTTMVCSSRWYLILFFSYGFPSVIAPALSTPAFSAHPTTLLTSADQQSENILTRSQAVARIADRQYCLTVTADYLVISNIVAK